MGESFTLARAAERLGVSAKTMGRWLRAGRLPNARKRGGLGGPAAWEIGVADLDALDVAKRTRHDHDARLSALEARVAALADELRAQGVLRERAPRPLAGTWAPPPIVVPAPHPPSIEPPTPARPRVPTHRLHAPDGYERAEHFRRRHAVAKQTLQYHVARGVVAVDARPSQARPGEVELWLTPEAQRAAIAHWRAQRARGMMRGYRECDVAGCACRAGADGADGGGG